MKENYFYIDEAGSIDGNSNFFILGCYKTDTPEAIRDSIKRLKTEILESPYFAFERAKLNKHGFHACENHFDIKARFYNLISILNVRAYILLVDKKSVFFQDLKSKHFTSKEIYSIFIEKLLADRLIKNRNDSNNLIFEQYGNKPNQWKKDIDIIISKVKNRIDNSFKSNLSYNIDIHDKRDENLSIIDYLNYLFVQFFEKNEVNPRMIDNFKIIEPKIALVYKMDKDLFYDKNKRLDIKSY